MFPINLKTGICKNGFVFSPAIQWATIAQFAFFTSQINSVIQPSWLLAKYGILYVIYEPLPISISNQAICFSVALASPIGPLLN